MLCKLNFSTNFSIIFFSTFTTFTVEILSFVMSHSQLLGFQNNPVSHIPLSINSLHSHLHLSSFQRCLLLQTLASNLHLHLQVSCHSLCLVSLFLGIRLKMLTFIFLTKSGTQILHMYR